MNDPRIEHPFSLYNPNPNPNPFSLYRACQTCRVCITWSRRFQASEARVLQHWWRRTSFYLPQVCTEWSSLYTQVSCHWQVSGFNSHARPVVIHVEEKLLSRGVSELDWNRILKSITMSATTLRKCKKLQFIHRANGDRSKTAKIIKKQY